MALFKKPQSKTTEKPKKAKEVTAEAQVQAPLQPVHASALHVRQAWITEKAGFLSNSRQYVFIVNKNANKPEVKKAIEGIYKVKVSEVNIINTKGKKKRLGRSTGRSAHYKKAIVSLKEGNTIDIMPH